MYGACGCNNGGYSGAHFHGPGYFADSLGIELSGPGLYADTDGSLGAVFPAATIFALKRDLAVAKAQRKAAKVKARKNALDKRIAALRKRIARIRAQLAKQIAAIKKRKGKVPPALSAAYKATGGGSGGSTTVKSMARRRPSAAAARLRKARLKAKMMQQAGVGPWTNVATGIRYQPVQPPAANPDGAQLIPSDMMSARVPGQPNALEMAFQAEGYTFKPADAPFSTEASEAEGEEASDTSEEGESGGLMDINADNWYKSPLVWAAAAVGGFLFLRKKRKGGGDGPRQNPRRNRRNRR
jgi:hypothetical protein